MDQEMLDRVVAVTTAEGTLAHRMGIKILSASGSEVVATMPVAGNIQPFGLLHGGASCVLAETIGSLGAALHAAWAGWWSVSRSVRRTTAAPGTETSPRSPPWRTGAGRSPPMRSSLPTRPVIACARHG